MQVMTKQQFLNAPEPQPVEMTAADLEPNDVFYIGNHPESTFVCLKDGIYAKLSGPSSPRVGRINDNRNSYLGPNSDRIRPTAKVTKVDAVLVIQ